jgi:hypothetical protein
MLAAGHEKGNGRARRTRHRDPEVRAQARLALLLRTMRGRGWDPGHLLKDYGLDAEAWVAAYLTPLARSRVRDDNLAFAAASMELLYANRPDTVRGNMYLLVSRGGWLPDTSDKSYDKTQRMLKNLRVSGVVPFDWVVDNVRSTIKPSSWAGLDDFAETVARAYRLDFWSRLPDYIEVIVEKDTVAGKLSAVTRQYNVPLHPIRGYSSITYAHDIARSWDRIDKPITVYYFGDHDPSGRDLERDIYESLEHFSKREFNWCRLGIDPEDFELYDVKPLAPKKKDSRYKRFVEQGWYDCAEVEAIPAAEMRRFLQDAIESHIPQGEWQRLQELERIERGQWMEYMAAMFPQREGGL